MLTPPNVNVYTFNNAVKHDAPTHVRIKRGNKIYLDEDIHSSGIVLHDYLNADEDKVIGKSVSKELTINFIRTEANRNPYQDLQPEFTYEIGVEINGTTEWINQGTFIPYDPDQYADEGIMTLVSHDYMDKFNIPAEDWLKGLTFPANFYSLFSSLCAYVGVTGDYGDGLTNIKTRSFTANPITNYGVMCRDILDAMAEACGCYARITPDKKCKFVSFNYQSYELLNNDIYEHKYKNYANTIVGLNVKNTEDDIGVMYPSTATVKQQVYVIVDNPFLKTANSTEEESYIVPLYNRLREHLYNPMDVVCVGNPLIEAGDVISAYRSINDNRSYPMCIYVKETQWNGALTDHYYSTGRRTRQAYTTPVRQKLSEGGRYHIFKNDIDQLYSEIADVEGDITQVDQKADNIALSAGKKARMWYSNTAPTGTTSDPLVANVDYWINTSDNRKLMRWTGSAWAAADDISKYTKYSGIDINQNGVDITGSKYVKIRAGSTGYWTYDKDGLTYSDESDSFFRILASGNAITRPGEGYTGAYIVGGGGIVEFYFWARGAANHGNAMQFTQNGIFMPPGQTDNQIYNVKRVHTEEIESRVYLDLYGGNGLRIFDSNNEEALFISPFADGTIEAKYVKIQGRDIVFKGTKANSALIRFWDNTADQYGNGIIIGDGGIAIVGAGESAWTTRSYAGVTAGTEDAYFTADGVVHICSNMNNGWASRKDFIFGTNGNLTVPGSVIQGSSRERKHDIKLIEDVSDKVDRLEPVSFIYNNDETNHKRFGLIYEDTVDVLPEICFEDDNHENGIDYTALVPVLLKEIQSLRKRVASLEQKN